MKLIIDIPEEYYQAIKEIPIEQSTADMLIIRNGTEPRKGRWIVTPYNLHICSNCNKEFWGTELEFLPEYKHCPNCGADMTEPTKADKE